MDSPTPGTSTSFVKAAAAVALPAEKKAEDDATISNHGGVGNPPVQRQRISLNIKTTVEECQQLFGASCHVKLTRCQFPVTLAVSNTTVKNEDSSDAESSSPSQKEKIRLTVPAVSLAAPVSNLVPKSEDESSTGSSSDDEEILPAEKPRHKKKRGRKSTVRTVDCPICGRTYGKQYFKIHMQAHTGKKDKSHKCEHCGRLYGLRSTLNFHKNQNPNGLCKVTDRMKRLRQEKIQKMARKLLETKWKPRGSWKCKICEKSMKNSSNYLSHMGSHAGERPYKCDQCGKCFADRRSLFSHQKIHIGIPECSCVFCGRGFYQEQHLFRHLRCHTEEKPFFCVVTGCGASFRHSKSLKIHQRMIHLKRC